jgi:TctA family transporter
VLALGPWCRRTGYPVAAMVLGIVMGTMVEQAFVTSLIKSDGSILPFFERPVSPSSRRTDGPHRLDARSNVCAIGVQRL